MSYEMSHSFVGFLFQKNFQSCISRASPTADELWSFRGEMLHWNAAGWLLLTVGLKEHSEVWIAQVNSMLLLLLIPGNQSWPQNFSVPKMKCHSNAEAHVLRLPLITALLLLEHLPNSNTVCKLAEQSARKNSQCYLFNWQLSQKVESQLLSFYLKQNSHQLQWDTSWNTSLGFGSDPPLFLTAVEGTRSCVAGTTFEGDAS